MAKQAQAQTQANKGSCIDHGKHVWTRPFGSIDGEYGELRWCSRCGSITVYTEAGKRVSPSNPLYLEQPDYLEERLHAKPTSTGELREPLTFTIEAVSDAAAGTNGASPSTPTSDDIVEEPTPEGRNPNYQPEQKLWPIPVVDPGEEIVFLDDLPLVMLLPKNLTGHESNADLKYTIGCCRTKGEDHGVVGRSILEVLPPDIKARAVRNVRDIARGKESYDIPLSSLTGVDLTTKTFLAVETRLSVETCLDTVVIVDAVELGDDKYPVPDGLHIVFALGSETDCIAPEDYSLGRVETVLLSGKIEPVAEEN